MACESPDYIFTGTSFRLVLETCTELEDATAQRIRYKSPSSSGEWEAQVQGSQIYVDVPDSAIQSPGTWFFQAIVNFGAFVSKGTIARLRVRAPLKVAN